MNEPVRHFATTQWSLVLAAAGDEETSRQALAELCQQYWPPLYAYIRRRGHSADDAQDLTQAFFVFVLEKRTLEAADRQRGRFRSLLLSSLNHFIANHRRGAHTERRGGGVVHLPFDFDDGERIVRNEPADHLTPERLFDRRWALTVLDASLEHLEQEYDAAGKGEIFAVLRAFLTPAADAPRYRDIAERFDMTEGAVKVAVHRLRRRYGEVLRERVAQTLASPEDVDDELRHLLAAFGD
ncbi:MAG: sigma-70 family RNA polymerase sigma factor [Pirellulaceae bacterium]